MKKKTLFVSYSHKDGRWVDAKREDNLIPWLEQQLGRDGIQFWYDHALKDCPGAPFKSEIQSKLEEADAAILLLSQNFASSDFIRDFELPLVRQRVEQGTLAVLPVLVSPIDWDHEEHLHWIGDLQMLPGWPIPLLASSGDPAKFELLRVEILQAIRKRLADRRPRQAENDATSSTSVPDTQPQIGGDNGSAALEVPNTTEKPVVLPVSKPAAAPTTRPIPPSQTPPPGPPPPPGIFRHRAAWLGVAAVLFAFVVLLLLWRRPEPAAKRSPAESRTPIAGSHASEPSPAAAIGEREPAPDTVPVPPDGKRLFSTESGVKFVGPGFAFAVAFSADGQRLAGLFTEHLPELQRWDLETRRPLRHCPIAYRATSVGAFSPDGTRAVVADTAGGVRPKSGAGVFDATSCGELNHFETPADVRGVAFSPDGGDVYVAGRQFVEQWAADGTAAKARHQFSALRSGWNTIAPGGRKVVLLDGDIHARVPGEGAPSIQAWNDTLTREVWHLESGPSSHTASVATSPDGKLLLAGQTGRVALMEMSSGRTVAVLACPGGLLLTVAFSPDGSLAAAGGNDFALCLWNVAKRQLLGISKPAELSINHVAFSHDGRQIAVAANHLFVFPVPQ